MIVWRCAAKAKAFMSMLRCRSPSFRLLQSKWQAAHHWGQIIVTPMLINGFKNDTCLFVILLNFHCILMIFVFIRCHKTKRRKFWRSNFKTFW